jgi:MFS family permease
MKPAPQAVPAPGSDSSGPSLVRNSAPGAGRAWYVLVVLTLAYVLSFIDRQILTLMVDPIRHDLHITETQMSLLMGASFAVFYTFFGIPLARLADLHSRRALIAGGITVWSAMTAACGLAKRFWQLAFCRMGVGVGEATLSPAAYSLIADSFAPNLRSTAMAIYSMGIYIGSGLSFMVGGLVIEFASGRESFVLPLAGAVHSWQLVFLLVGLPGPLLALLLLPIEEPPRTGVSRSKQGAAASASPGEMWGYVRDNRATLVYLNLGIALLALDGYGAFSWVPSFFLRRHGWAAGQTGMVFGLIVASCGTLGVVTGGRLADWMRLRGHADANLRVALVGALGSIPCGLFYPLVPSAYPATALLAPVVFFMSMPFGVAPAAISQMTPATLRARGTALYLFVINLIGMGLGPTLVATLTEHVFRDAKSVGYSLLIVGTFARVCGALLLWLGLPRYLGSLDYLKKWSDAHLCSQ